MRDWWVKDFNENTFWRNAFWADRVLVVDLPNIDAGASPAGTFNDSHFFAMNGGSFGWSDSAGTSTNHKEIKVVGTHDAIVVVVSYCRFYEKESSGPYVVIKT